MFRVVRPSPAVLLTVSIVLGTASFVAVPLLAQTLLAQNGDAPKAGEAGKADPVNKPDPGKADPGKADAAKADPAKADAGKADAGKADQGKSETAKDAGARPEESAEAARILLGPAGRGECMWIGKRVVGLLWKDDLDTAFRHLDLYDRFGCPGEHLQLSFRCITRQGDIQKDPPKDQKVFDKSVEACWLNPATPAPPANPPTAAVEKPGTK